MVDRPQRTRKSTRLKDFWYPSRRRGNRRPARSEERNARMNEDEEMRAQAIPEMNQERPRPLVERDEREPMNERARDPVAIPQVVQNNPAILVHVCFAAFLLD